MIASNMNISINLHLNSVTCDLQMYVFEDTIILEAFGIAQQIIAIEKGWA